MVGVVWQIITKRVDCNTTVIISTVMTHPPMMFILILVQIYRPRKTEQIRTIGNQRYTHLSITDVIIQVKTE